jgi:hypothetical protein
MSDVKFTALVSEDALIRQYKSDRDIFNEIYKNLKQTLDS